MKILLFTLTIMTLFGTVQAQNNYLDSENIYGLSVSFKQKSFSDRCGCEVNRKVTKNCDLYKVSIDSVYFMLDSTVYKSGMELAKIEYMMVTDQYNGRIESGKTYFITGNNSSAKEYIMLNGIFNDDKIFEDTSYIAGYFSSLIDCKQFNFFQKILLAFRINREKIYAKAPSLDKNKNSFWVYIDNQK